MSDESYVTLSTRMYGFESSKKDLISLKQVCTSEKINDLIDADLAFLNSQYDKARDIYLALSEQFPDDVIIASKMIQQLDFYDHDELRNTQYYRLIFDKEDFFSLKARLVIAIGEDDTTHINEVFSKLLPLITDDRLLNYYKALHYSLNENYEKCYYLYKMLYDKFEFNSPTVTNLAMTLYHLDRVQEAIQLLEISLQKDPDNFRTHYSIGFNYLKNKEYDQAIIHLSKCLETIPNSSFIHSLLGDSYFEDHKDIFKAKKHYKIALQYKKSERTLFDLAYYFFSLNDYKNAVVYDEDLIKINKKNSLGYLLMAICNDELKNDDVAFENYLLAKMYEDDPKSYVLESWSQYIDSHNISKYQITEKIISIFINSESDEGFSVANFHADINENDIINIIDAKLQTSNIQFSRLLHLPIVFFSGDFVFEAHALINHLLSICPADVKIECVLEIAKTFYHSKLVEISCHILDDFKDELDTLESITFYIEILESLKKYQTAINYIKEHKKNFAAHDYAMESALSRLNGKRNEKTIDETLDKIIVETDKKVKKKCEMKDKELMKFLLRKKTGTTGIHFYGLRKWNSYTPILCENGKNSVGGGFFLSLNGKGIVIDPGMNFLENYRLYPDFSFSDIDYVVISHAHNDHTADLENILTLLYKHNKSIKDMYKQDTKAIYRSFTDTLSADYRKRDSIKNNIYDDIKQSVIEKENRIAENKKRHLKKITLLMSKSTLKKYSGLLDMMKEKANYEVVVLEDMQTYFFGNERDNYSMTSFTNKHDDVISDYSSVGLVFRLGEYSLIYTGDTRITHELLIKMQKLLKDYKKENSVFLCNLGGFTDDEIEYDVANFENTYKNHLGRVGMYSMVKTFEPSVCLVSEFGEEFFGHRQDVVDIYQKNMRSTHFFVCEVGLEMVFNNGIQIDAIDSIQQKIKVTNKFEYHNKVKAIEIDSNDRIYYYITKNKSQDEQMIEYIKKYNDSLVRENKA